jgi:hypothetical protein
MLRTDGFIPLIGFIPSFLFCFVLYAQQEDVLNELAKCDQRVSFDNYGTPAGTTRTGTSYGSDIEPGDVLYEPAKCGQILRNPGIYQTRERVCRPFKPSAGREERFIQVSPRDCTVQW